MQNEWQEETEMANHASGWFHSMEDNALDHDGQAGGHEQIARRDRPCTKRRRQTRVKRGAASLGVSGRGNRRSTYRALKVGKLRG
jgi:hypothetical protein